MLAVENNSAVESKNEMLSEGRIDTVVGAVLIGWAYNQSSATIPLGVRVMCENKVVGHGIANIFRQDLLDRSIGSGKHGFAIDLDVSVSDGKKHQITIVDEATGLPIPTNTFQLKVETKAIGKIDKVENGLIHGSFDFNILPDVAEHQITVHIDGVPHADVRCVRQDHTNIFGFHCPLPSFVFDGMPHYIEASITGLSTSFKPHIETFNSILTPWKYIYKSSLKNNYAQLSRTSSYRYDSLRNHISSQKSISSKKSSLENIIIAHDVVVEGFIDRKNYPKLSLPLVEKPIVSIIVPVYNNFPITYHCIASNILAFNNTNYEVIIVDDCSTDKTTEIEDIIANVKVVRNDSNLGFLRGCNKAAKSATGEYILLLNNDTEVTSGWLDEMVDTAIRFNKVGAVGSKLIYPDGKLQEAGGIVWNNGKPWNIGNRENPQDSKFNYVRESDYLSGAALMVKRSVWEELDGFSDEFAPAYYEDTDLAFKIRDAGYRTMYCPSSVVIHFEGMSNGTDLDSGIKKNQVINAPKFRSKWRNAYQHNGVEGKDLHIQKDRGNSARVLMIDYAVPKPDHDAGSYAAIQEMKLLQELGCKITFAPANFAHMGAYTNELERQGVECVYAPFYTSMQQFIQERGGEYDVVYITRYDIAISVIDQVRKFTNAKVVFNNADLHFLRELREALSKGDTDLEGPLATRDKELSLMRKVDAVLSYNELEHAVITSHNLRSNNIFKCPWVLESKKSRISFAERKGIAFLGGFGHAPNCESVQYFVNKVMPIIRKRRPGLTFHIYGSNVTKDIQALSADDIIVEGFVESLDSVFESCRVFVAPLLSGAGIKGKVLESIAYGVPSVLSPIAIEATGLVDQHSALVAITKEEWADSVLELYDSQHRWDELSANASVLAKRVYSKENGMREFRKVLDYIEVYPANRAVSLFENTGA